MLLSAMDLSHPFSRSGCSQRCDRAGEALGREEGGGGRDVTTLKRLCGECGWLDHRLEAGEGGGIGAVVSRYCSGSCRGGGGGSDSRSRGVAGWVKRLAGMMLRK